MKRLNGINKNSIKTKLMVYLMAVVLLFSGVGITLLTNNFGSNGNDSNAAEITYDNVATDLGKFADGTPYMFTDPTKVEDFRAKKISTDTTIIRVDSTAAHGSQKNPYVIANEDDWVKFSEIAYSWTNTRDKYFVLANDLDFTGRQFYMANSFSGTFYGMNHTIRNINVSTWKNWDGTDYKNIGYGVFAYTGYGVTITDLSNDNFYFSNMQNFGTTAYASRCAPTGGIIGHFRVDQPTAVNSYILNCHTNGEINFNRTDYTV